MEVHIGKEIEKIATKRRISAAELAKEINTGVRNIYRIYNSDDLYISQLIKISETLNYNFFELFHPLAVESDPSIVNEPPHSYTKAEELLTFRFEVKYPLSKTQDIGNFLKHIHDLAEKVGFKMV